MDSCRPIKIESQRFSGREFEMSRSPSTHTSSLCFSPFTCSLNCTGTRSCINISTIQLLKEKKWKREWNTLLLWLNPEKENPRYNEIFLSRHPPPQKKNRTQGLPPRNQGYEKDLCKFLELVISIKSKWESQRCKYEIPRKVVEYLLWLKTFLGSDADDQFLP